MVTKNETLVVLDFENVDIGLSDRKKKWIGKLNDWVNKEYKPIRKVVFLDSRRANGKREFLDKCNWQIHDVVTREKDEDEQNLVLNNAVDIELAMYTMDYAYRNDIDRVILISGDGDYASLVNYLRRMHKQVEVVSMMDSLSGKLKDAADITHYLELILGLIEDKIEGIDAKTHLAEVF